jgi:hypothetical protein
MKLQTIFPALVVAFSDVSIIEAQTVQNFPFGVEFGYPARSFINSGDIGSNRSFSQFFSLNGGLILYSDPKETARGQYDGGIALWGDPISIIPASGPLYETGTFDVWRGTDYENHANPACQPVFRIDTGADTANFDSLAVSITNGSLSIAGSPALTSATAPGILTNSGFVTDSSFDARLASSVPPSSAAWKSAYVARGNIGTGVGLLGLGTGQASGFGSVALSNAAEASGFVSFAAGAGAKATADRTLALGYNAKAVNSYAVAIGPYAEAGLTGTISNYSTAMGYSSKAHSEYSTALGPYSEATAKLAIAIGGGKAAGQFSLAGIFGSATGAMSLSIGGYSVKSGIVTSPGPNSTIGSGSVALGGVKNTVSGDYSYGFGLFNSPTAAASISLGSAAIGGGTTNAWVDTEPLFELGNTQVDVADPVEPLVGRSNAITTLKNGQTTLTNKAWKADSNVTPAISNSNGEALVVEGHTRLRGMVVIEQPQGDISMGIYGD